LSVGDHSDPLVFFRRDVSPQALSELISTKSTKTFLLDSIAMFQVPPAWTVTTQAPSDYELIKLAQELRSDSSTSSEEALKQPKYMISTSYSPSLTPDGAIVYPLAFAAIGLAPPSSKKYSKSTLMLLALLALTFIAIATQQLVSVSSRSIMASSPLTAKPTKAVVAGAHRKAKVPNKVKSLAATKKKSSPTLLLAPTLPRLPVVGNALTMQPHSSTTSNSYVSEKIFSVLSTSSIFRKSKDHPILPSAPAVKSSRPSWLLGLVNTIEDAVKYTHI
jgi:hypothetical protein